jgi:formylmethanofuran dehydrogenase subunit E
LFGLRMGLLSGRLLDVEVPRTGKRLMTIVETDGCGVGCRTLRIEGFGKVAAAVVDIVTEAAVRIAPSRRRVRPGAIRH